MKDNLTDVTILVDRSGSMSSIKSDMEGVIQEFLKDQRDVGGDCVVSLYSFDGLYGLELEEHCVAKNVSEQIDFVLHPRNCTPLHDAIGTLIDKTGKRLSDINEEERPSKVIFVIITDGLENASRKYSSKRIREMVELQQNTYHWSFIYFGANQDAILTGQRLGFIGSSCATYDADSECVKTAGDLLSKGVSCLRSCSLDDYESFSKGNMKVYSNADYEGLTKVKP